MEKKVKIPPLSEPCMKAQDPTTTKPKWVSKILNKPLPNAQPTWESHTHSPTQVGEKGEEIINWFEYQNSSPSWPNPWPTHTIAEIQSHNMNKTHFKPLFLVHQGTNLFPPPLKVRQSKKKMKKRK